MNWVVRVVVLMAFGLSLCAASFSYQKWGSCPSVPSQKEVDINKAAGLWYEYSRFYNPMEGKTVCQHTNISVESEEKFKVDIKYFDPERNETKTRSGRGYQDSQDHGEFHIKFHRFIPSSTYHVLSTDYSTYVLAWRCVDFMLFHFEMAWLLSRKPGIMDISTKTKLYNMLEQHQVDPNQFQEVQQHDCPY